MKNALQGLTVLNTRPREAGRALTIAIQQAGGSVIELPALCIEPTHDWLDTLPSLENCHHVIFISPNAVHHFFQGLASWAIPWPLHLRATAIGPATAAAIVTYGVAVNELPVTANSEQLLAQSNLQDIKQQTILLVKGIGGLPLIEESLITRGASVLPLAVYRRTLPTYPQQLIHSLWQDSAVGIILFTSGQAIHHFKVLFNEPLANDWLCNTPCLVVSERIANVAAACGITTCVSSTIDTVVDTLCTYNQGLMHDNRTRG